MPVQPPQLPGKMLLLRMSAFSLAMFLFSAASVGVAHYIGRALAGTDSRAIPWPMLILLGLAALAWVCEFIRLIILGLRTRECPRMDWLLFFAGPPWMILMVLLIILL